VRIVHLTRSNQIDVLVSEERARETGVSHIQARATLGLAAIILDAATLVDRIHRLNRKPRQVRTTLRLLCCPTLKITYEALLQGPEEFERILQFLGVEVSNLHLQSSLEKRGVRSHREAISNYNEIRRDLRPTPYLNMLRE
jgi:LPS sulfotransferase NodH